MLLSGSLSLSNECLAGSREGGRSRLMPSFSASVTFGSNGRDQNCILLDVNASAFFVLEYTTDRL